MNNQAARHLLPKLSLSILSGMQPTIGYIPFKGYETYYKIFGEVSDKPPLLVLHGGPGGAHNYLLSLAELAGDRQVIFYDQLGCGQSDHPKDDSLWTVELFVEEVERVREHLKLEMIHLLGHSWGGMLAIEYLLRQPKGVVSAVLASAMVDMPFYQAEVDKLKQDLPPDIYEVMKRQEVDGTTDSKAYHQAVQEYEKQHIYRHGAFPPEFSTPKGAQGDAYRVMWGASEAFANGSLKRWTVLDRLSEITVPILITSGQYDELTPAQALATHQRLPGSQLKIFTAGSHCVHVEFPEEYRTVVSDFLASVEASA